MAASIKINNSENLSEEADSQIKLTDDEGVADDEATITYGATRDTLAFTLKSKRSDLDDIALDVSSADGLLPVDTPPNSNFSSPHRGGELLDSSQTEPIVSTRTYPGSSVWWRHPRVRDNWKVVLSSLMLTLFGTCLAVVGIIIEVCQSTVVQSYMFFAAAAVCLIPGVYHVVYLYCAIKGTRGFSFYNMPVFK